MREATVVDAAQNSACPQCGAALGPEASVCPKCGAEIAEASVYVCTACGAAVSVDATVCPQCGADVSEIAPEGSSRAPALRKRYDEGYIAAQRLVMLGGVVKIVGYALAGLLLLAALVVALNGVGRPGTFQWSVLAIAVGLLFYIWGTTLSANGHRLTAVLDTAINNSPFLSDDQRAEIMGLEDETSSE
jgi:ribosomal protein L40E